MSDEAPVVPVLHACITCGLSVESGTGPGDLAWHDCDEVNELRAAALPPPPPPPPGLQTAIDHITQVISANAHKMNGRELADLVDSLAKFAAATGSNNPAKEGGSHGGVSAELLAFLANQ